MRKPATILFAVLIAGCGAICGSNAAAQVNIERLRPADDDAEGLTAQIKVEVSSRTGNVDITSLSLGARADYIRDRIHTFLLARGGVDWVGGNRVSNDGLAHARLTRSLSSVFDVEVFGQVDYNRSRLLDFRRLGGAGARVKAWETEPVSITIGSALMLEHERYDLADDATHPEHETMTRWSNYVNARVRFSESVTLVTIAYAQPRVDVFEDVRLLSESRLGVALSRNLLLANTVRLRYDSRPPDGIESLDTTLLFEVQLDFS